MEVIALKRFRDKKANVIRNQGDVFELTQARFSEINAALPGWIEPTSVMPLNKPTIANTKAEIMAYLDAANIKYAPNTTKKNLLALIE